MFEITRDDIAALNDEDLRTMIGLLCEAELRRANLPVSAVTWGGNQTAKDGGLDVLVAFLPEARLAGFIPRPATGFQVKKPDMPASEVAKEMKPGGVLRPVIEELAAESGAYAGLLRWSTPPGGAPPRLSNLTPSRATCHRQALFRPGLKVLPVLRPLLVSVANLYAIPSLQMSENTCPSIRYNSS